MIQINGDLIFLDGSGQLIASNGSLTLRADTTSTKDIIIGSGASLRPDKNLAIDLGTRNLKWNKLWTGNIDSISGQIGNLFSNQLLTTASGAIFFTNVASILVNQNSSWDFGTDSVLVVQCEGAFTTRPIIFSSSFGAYSPAATLSDAVDFRAVSGNIIPDTDAKLKLGDINKRWATIYSASGIFNIIGPPTSGTFIQFNGSIIPGIDRTFVLGTATQRFSEVRASSGIFNAISPPTSGSFINIHGSLIPGRADLYALGTGINRWAIANITSGLFSIINTSNIQVTNILLDTSPTIQLISAGPLSVDLNGQDLNFSNAGQIDFGVTSLNSITSVNADSAVFSSATIETSFGKRPTVNGSGVALASENYFEVYGGRFLNLGSTTNGTLRIDPDAGFVAGADDLFINNRDVRLTGFVINTLHLNGSQPADWILRLRINEETVDRCSGLFTWAPTNSTNRTTVGRWIGNATLPSGSRAHLIIDNNGGAAIGVVYAKAWVGMTVSGVA